ncbi:MAG: hypothetical protein Q9195_004299 [Heterodermia aff. obscurata]
MAASAASSPPSPASVTSPQALAPASSSSTNKSSIPPPTSLQTPSIFTNKEWVVPPRPKPGRKPAADTPPTKRKAQNRAAQRAFRERRAARVGELEEQTQQIEEEHEKERETLKYRIQQLQVEVDRYSRLVVSLSTKCQRLEEELSSERRISSGGERRMRSGGEINFGNGDVVPLRPRNGVPHSGTDTPQASARSVDTRLDEASMGCGRCSTDTRCECIEEVLGMSDNVSEAPPCPTKRPHSPASVLESKRNRHLDVKPEEEEREIDFTERFSTKGTTTSQTAPSRILGERAITGISLSCADAYATLSRHPAYERASEDPGAWIPKLATIPGGAERPAFEVEAASVMQTLRFFDRRFGREA